MTTYNLNQPHYGFDFVTAAIEGAGDLLHSVAKSIRHEHEMRTAVRALKAMSDYELSDMGIHRGEIEKVVRGR